MPRLFSGLALCAALLVSPVAFAQGATRVMLVQLEAVGADSFGCGDRIVAVPVAVREGADPLRVALDQLLARGGELARNNGLHDALASSELQVHELVFEDHAVTVHLTGTLRLAGTCDAPRVREQLQRSVLQYREFRSARFLIDGVDLEELLSGR